MFSHLTGIENLYTRNKDFSDVKEKVKNLFDLSETEVTIYMKLLINDKPPATEVSNITGIQRTRTYEIFRRLQEKELIALTSEKPQRYSVVSPRIAIDNWLFKQHRVFEEKNSMLMTLLPTLQKIWNDQNEELISSRV
jgi:sugar-specific transcriptional regulator TrmB